MTDDGLTCAERATLFGLTFNDQLHLEIEQPWVAHWSARYGAGLDNLRRWLAGGRPRADHSDVCAVGDRRIVAAVRNVIAQLPDAPRHHIVDRVFVVGSGVSSSGWCGRMPKMPCDSPHLISLATDAPEVIAHELAHSWQTPQWPAGARMTVAQSEVLAGYFASTDIAAGQLDEVIDRQLDAEVAADALATAWGFWIDSTTGDARERRRRSIRADNEQRAEQYKPPDQRDHTSQGARS